MNDIDLVFLFAIAFAREKKSANFYHYVIYSCATTMHESILIAFISHCVKLAMLKRQNESNTTA